MSATRVKSKGGKSLSAMSVDEFKAVGTATLNELEHFGLKSPAFMAKTTEKKLERTDLPFKELRQIVQRAWDKARHTRADLYKVYISRLNSGVIMGDTPPITLFVPEQGRQGDGKIEFEYTAPLIAIDGETQTEARFRLREDDPDSGDIPFAVTIHHGISEHHAMKILHDYNHYVRPIPESKLGMKNVDGPMSIAIAEAVKDAGLDQEAINLVGLGNKKKVAGFNQAMAFIAGYAAGGDALKRSATSWFDALNTAGSGVINGQCVPSLTELFIVASERKDVGMAQPLVWQVAGVLASEGRAPSVVNWDAGLEAYARTTPKHAGRSKVSDRLAVIYKAMAN